MSKSNYMLILNKSEASLVVLFIMILGGQVKGCCISESIDFVYNYLVMGILFLPSICWLP